MRTKGARPRIPPSGAQLVGLARPSRDTDQVDEDLDLLARFYTAEALTSVQDGNRFRVDLNYRF